MFLRIFVPNRWNSLVFLGFLFLMLYLVYLFASFEPEFPSRFSLAEEKWGMVLFLVFFLPFFLAVHFNFDHIILVGGVNFVYVYLLSCVCVWGIRKFKNHREVGRLTK